MKKMIIAALATFAFGFAVQAHAAATINGAGATFPYPVYGKWAHAYNKETGVRLNYQAIGSGGGIKQIKAKTVDFGASDAPLKPEALDAAGLMQYPMIMGGVVPVVNIKGIGANQLVLSGDVLADIYLNKITKWNDKRIKKLNPSVNLPDDAIAVVHRADGSGTTWIFTNYLTKVSADWAKDIGNNKAVSWPTGLGGKGNQGVAAFVSKVPGSIGYVEYAYALQNHMSSVRLVNHEGNAVAPTAENFQAAAAGADWAHAKGYYMVLTDQPGAKSWPITGASFILMYKSQANAATAKEVLKFFDWSYKNGSKMAMELDYVPMPKKVIDMVEKTWSAEIRTANGGAIWK
ncbi:phosphate ABC transporter substrate-binding protein PstS [Mariprofundus ferrooxydans]|uniref:Phosphate-binding protein PstS n=1 Tax=Mariprofundus ferrooxydans PV-1 TaxID=314345 RepID=Q0F0D3_9PROT|nr:phosphate ABC transporter substrate-binding protein PstS [Mariprofundus ferrooxydans]EAU55095.1 ABC transporter phosphate-binding protein [Mariprofundus ferrooxydans PV-1]KON46867.1 phosphate ABC transporter substrate-binding protein [Mariprofundus ferrooxydans]